MATRANPVQTWRFGVFEVDARNMELRRGGKPVKMREQSFRILLFLLEHAGELVTREDLRQLLWPSDTFVDFDHSLNTAVMKLREALGDSADRPLYIETIPKRGYRFVAPVSLGGTPQAESAEASGPNPQAAAVASDLDPAQILEPAPMAINTKTAIRKRWRLIVPAGLALLGLSVASYFYFHRAPKLTDTDTIVLADFVNNTGDPIFDSTLRQGLAIQLEQSPFLKIMDDQQIQGVLRLMSLPPGARITNPIAHEICVREGAAATVDGSIASLGKDYVITLEAITCQDGETLAREQIQADDKEHVLNAVGTAATALRAKLGESLNSIQKLNRPLEQGTTPSLEALQNYSAGYSEMTRGHF